MKTGEPINDHTIKHLEFIQGVIARLASDSFLMKGWSLTVAGAFFGFSAKDLNWRIAAVGLLPVVAFWGLDAYFLSRERMYRDMYEAVRTKEPSVGPFSMNYRPFKKEENWFKCKNQKPSWWCTFWSRTLWLFYVTILGVGLAVTIAGVIHSGP